MTLITEGLGIWRRGKEERKRKRKIIEGLVGKRERFR